MKRKTKNWLMVGLALVAALYLSNLTAGFIEVIPDNVPLFGNVDEGLAGAVIAYALSQLGR